MLAPLKRLLIGTLDAPKSHVVIVVPSQRCQRLRSGVVCDHALIAKGGIKYRLQFSETEDGTEPSVPLFKAVAAC